MGNSLEGQWLGPYRIDRRVSEQDIATLYRAVDGRDRRTVAVRVARVSLEAEAQDRFRRDADQANTLQHPHIVPVFDHDVLEDGRPYVVTAWVEGATLADRLSRGRRLPLKQTLQVARELARALDHAHRRGVVHGDVKPSNVWLDQDGQILLAGFGFMTVASLDYRPSAGVGLATPEYATPEQLRSQVPGPWTDVYALGLVLYAMLTGRPPFVGPAAKVVEGHLQESPPPVRRGSPAQRGRLQALLTRALAKSPAGRYETADALVSDCEAALVGDGKVMPVAGPGQRRPGLPMLPAILTVLSAALALAGTLWFVIILAGGPIALPFGANAPWLTNLRSAVVGTPTPTAEQPSPTPGPDFVERPTPPASPVPPLSSATPTAAPTAALTAQLPAGPSPEAGATSVPASSASEPTGTSPSLAGPTPTAANTPTPTSTAVPTQTPTQTATPTPTVTLTASPTRTATRTATPAPTPSATSAAAAAVAAPVPDGPPDGANVSGTPDVTFSWHWAGQPAPNQGFEVRLWHEGDGTHYGAADVQEMAKSVEALPGGRYAVTLRVGRAHSVGLHSTGDYLWSVAVVRLDPYAAVGPESPARSLIGVRAEGP